MFASTENFYWKYLLAFNKKHSFAGNKYFNLHELFGPSKSIEEHEISTISKQRIKSFFRYFLYYWTDEFLEIVFQKKGRN